MDAITEEDVEVTITITISPSDAQMLRAWWATGPRELNDHISNHITQQVFEAISR